MGHVPPGCGNCWRTTSHRPDSLVWKTTNRASGENCPIVSMPEVLTATSGLRSSPDIGKAHRWPEAAYSTKRPSRDQSSTCPDASANIVSDPAPVDAFRYNLYAPVRFEANAICFPSGDQTCPKSTAGSDVNF